MQLHLISWYVNAVNNVEPKRKSWRGEGSKRCFQNKLRRLPVGKLADEILFTDAAMSPLSYQWWFCSLVTHDLVPPVFIFPNHSFHSHLLIKQQLESLSSTWYTNRGKSKHSTFENRNLCVKAVTISYYWSRPKFHGCYSIFSLWSSLSHTTIFCCTALERYIYIYILCFQKWQSHSFLVWSIDAESKEGPVLCQLDNLGRLWLDVFLTLSIVCFLCCGLLNPSNVVVTLYFISWLLE